MTWIYRKKENMTIMDIILSRFNYLLWLRDIKYVEVLRSFSTDLETSNELFRSAVGLSNAGSFRSWKRENSRSNDFIGVSDQLLHSCIIIIILVYCKWPITLLWCLNFVKCGKKKRCLCLHKTKHGEKKKKSISIEKEPKQWEIISYKKKSVSALPSVHHYVVMNL